MTSRFQLTRLQLLAWQVAKRESMSAEDRIAEKQVDYEALGEAIKLDARAAAQNYRDVLAAIFLEHGCDVVPDDTGLEKGTNGEKYFTFTAPDEAYLHKLPGLVPAASPLNGDAHGEEEG